MASARRTAIVRVPTLIALAPEPSLPSAAKAGSGARKAAKEMRIVAPVLHGRVTDEFAMEVLLRDLLTRASGRLSLHLLRHVGSLIVSASLPDFERARLTALLVDVGLSRVRMLDSLLAAARGSRLPYHRPQGQVVLDLGGGKLDFAVLSMGGLVNWSRQEFGGKELDEAISAYVQSRYDVILSPKAAEEIKLQIGSVYPQAKPETMEISGALRRSGVAKKIVLNDSEIRDVLVDSCEPLVMGIQRGFQAVPPELAGDITRNGITLVGGGALLKGLSEFLRERTGLACFIPPDPINAVVRGARSLLRAAALDGRGSGSGPSVQGGAARAE